MSHLLLTFIGLSLVSLTWANVPGRVFQTDNGCSQRKCQESALNECAARGQSWAAFNFFGTQTCVCCNDERDSLEVAGSHDDDRVGLFFGNVLRVCESLHIDEGHCRSRESRDCNFIPAFKNSKYVGCFYCRPRCDYETQCQDLGRTCDLSKESQPVRACTGSGSGYIPGFDDPREYETALKKNYLVIMSRNRSTTAQPVEAVTASSPLVTSKHRLPSSILSHSKPSSSTPFQRPCHINGKPADCSFVVDAQHQQQQQQSIDSMTTLTTMATTTTTTASPNNQKFWSNLPSILKQWQQQGNGYRDKVNEINQQQDQQQQIHHKQQLQQEQHQQQQQQHEQALQEHIDDHRNSGHAGHTGHSLKDCKSTTTTEAYAYDDDGFEVARSPNGNAIHSSDDQDRFERGFKPADSNETLYVIKNNHRQISNRLSG